VQLYNKYPPDKPEQMISIEGKSMTYSKDALKLINESSQTHHQAIGFWTLGKLHFYL
jgi:hypothetical protein